MAFDLGTPVNTALLLYILYAVQRILFPSNALPKTVPHEFKGGYSWMPKAHPPTLLFQTYTPKTLEPFNGEDGKRILLAISGVVYDVTAGRNFYGPRTSFRVLLVFVRLLIFLLACPFSEGMYANFAGRDASRGMAKQSFDLGACMLFDERRRPSSHRRWHPDMLTPIDQPLDKLDNLTPEELCVLPAFHFVLVT